MRPSLIDTLRERRLLCDGGLGTELARLAPGALPYERLNLESPAVVAGVHAAYLAAGCDVVTTNSFCGDPGSLSAWGLEGRAEELARAAAELARAAADAGARAPRFVLGSIGPGARGAGAADTELEGVVRVAAALLEGGADALAVETVRDPQRTRAVLRALGGLGAELVVSFTPLDDDPLAPLAGELEALGVGLVAFNCVEGPGGLERALAGRPGGWNGPLGGWPNAGRPEHGARGDVWPVGPAEFARAMAALTGEHDLRLVGGCCGTTPAHLAALRELLPTG